MPAIDRDVCVIGSGFGGGVAALRFTEAGRSAVVLEAGNRWDGRPGSKQFQQTLSDFDYWLDLYSAYAGINFSQNAVSAVVTGRGLGGGSLVYSMCSLRAPGWAFDDPVWPGEINRAELDPFYSRAENQLDVTQLQWTGELGTDEWRIVSKKDGAFARACRAAGVSCDPVPSTANRNCRNIGWCMAGCVAGGRNSVDKAYLNPAEDQGALIVTGATATKIEPRQSGRRWKVTYRVAGQIFAKTVLADTVVVSAGAVGSPVLLMKSAGVLPGGVSQQVGRNLSRGGDMVLFGALPDDLPPDIGDLQTYKGKTIGVACFEYMFHGPPGHQDDWQGFVLQPIMALPPVASVFVADPGGLTWKGDMRTFGTGPKHYMQKYGTRLLQVGVMGFDGMDGKITLGAGGAPSISFETSDATRKMWECARAGFRQIIEDGAGGTVLPSWDEIRNDNFTIHPLGTCRMADSVAGGVLRHDCAVWKGDGSGVHEGLYVMDASTMSSPIGVNTSLTTAAIAERACAEILGR